MYKHAERGLKGSEGSLVHLLNMFVCPSLCLGVLLGRCDRAEVATA